MGCIGSIFNETTHATVPQTYDSIIYSHYKNFIELHLVAGVIGFFNNDQVYENFNQYLALVHHKNPINFKTFCGLPRVPSYQYMKRPVMDKIMDGYCIAKVVLRRSNIFNEKDVTDPELMKDLIEYLSITDIVLDPEIMKMYINQITPEANTRLEKLWTQLQKSLLIAHNNMAIIDDYYGYNCDKCGHHLDNCHCMP